MARRSFVFGSTSNQWVKSDNTLHISFHFGSIRLSIANICLFKVPYFESCKGVILVNLAAGGMGMLKIKTHFYA